MLNKPLICRPVCFSQFLYMGSNIVNEHPYMLYHWAQLLLFLWDTVFEIMHQRNEHFRAMNIWCILSGYSLEMLHILYSQQQSVRLPLSWWLLSLRSIFLFLFFPFSFGVVLDVLIKALHPTNKLLLIPTCHFLQDCWKSIMLLCELYKAKMEPHILLDTERNQNNLYWSDIWHCISNKIEIKTSVSASALLKCSDKLFGS